MEFGTGTTGMPVAPQACLCKIGWVCVKHLPKHTEFGPQFGVQILGVELTRVSLHYK